MNDLLAFVGGLVALCLCSSGLVDLVEAWHARGRA